MKLFAKGLVVAAAIAVPMLVASPADAAGISAPDAPAGVLTCTNAYLNDPNPNPLVPKYGILFVNATGTYLWTLDEVSATEAYAICVVI
jgi:hypothetical protein